MSDVNNPFTQADITAQRARAKRDEAAAGLLTTISLLALLAVPALVVLAYLVAL